MKLQRSDISSPFIGGIVGAVACLYFFPPGNVGFLLSMLAGLLGSITGFGVLECLAGAIFASRFIYKVLYVATLALLLAGAYLALTTCSPVLNPRSVFTLF